MGNTKHKKTVEEKEFLKDIGETIRFHRLKLGYSQYDLAFKADVADNTIGQIERGESNVSLITLQRVCKVLKINIYIK